MTQYDVAVLGAGPSGLTAAYRLGKAGARVAVLERAPHCGGLMRGIRRGEFTLDLGRKELYSRFPEVHSLWTELLGSDYREYAHRVGVLYGGRILERESKHKGKLRGLSMPQLAQLGGSYLAAQLKPGAREARMLADFYTYRYGRAYYDFFVHGYTLKFEGRSPEETPNTGNDGDVRRFAFLRGKQSTGAPAAKEDILFSEQNRWRHPAKGTQQIVDRLEEESRHSGVHFLLDTEVQAVEARSEGTHKVSFRQNGEASEIEAPYVVSSLPMPLLMGLLRPRPDRVGPPPAEEVLYKKSTALVYLFADEAPRFPHNWLEVTDMQASVGRVVNYATWNGDMVPAGKTALCVEYFGVESDPVMRLDKAGLFELAKKEAAANGLIDAAKITDHLVLQLPRVNASTFIGDRKQAWLQKASEYVEELPRFFESNRPGTDRATLAGMDAAEACIAGQGMSRRSLAASSAEL